MITSENWTFTYYKSSKLKAFINLAAEPAMEENKEPQLFYMVTTTDLDDQDVFQGQYLELEPAIKFINERYGNWEMIDASKNSGSDSGCGTCSAH